MDEMPDMRDVGLVMRRITDADTADAVLAVLFVVAIVAMLFGLI